MQTCLIAAALGLLTLLGCGPSKPNKSQCASACSRSFELHRDHILQAAKAAAGEDPKKAEENVAKAKAEWEDMKKSGRETKRIEDCTITCMAEGTSEEVSCMNGAKTIRDLKRCKVGKKKGGKKKEP